MMSSSRYLRFAILVTVVAVMWAAAGKAQAQGAGTPLRQVDWRTALIADPVVTVLNASQCFAPDTTPTICVDVPLNVPQAAGQQGIGDPDITGYISVPDIKYADLDGDGDQEAVLTVESGGTAGAVGYLIYHRAAPQPQLLVIRSGYGIGVTVNNGLLRESDPVYLGFEPNCCPTALWRTTYSLSGGSLQETAAPDLFLVLQGGNQLTSPAAATVYAYYSAINAGAYDFAYSLLSPAAQQQMPYAGWQAGFAATTSVSAMVSPVTATHVAVTITATNATNSGGSSTQTFNGTWVLVASNSAPFGYLLDTATIQ